jgi:hypothetical protein
MLIVNAQHLEGRWPCLSITTTAIVLTAAWIWQATEKWTGTPRLAIRRRDRLSGLVQEYV